MTDWNNDGDEDYTDGLLEGAALAGPWWVTLLVLLIFLGTYAWVHCG